MKCKFIKKDGKQCKANSLKSDEFCFFHSEKTKEEKQKAVSKGGSTNKQENILRPPVKIENTDDLKRVLVETINSLRMEKMSVHQANAITYISNTLIKILPSSPELDGKKGWASLLSEVYGHKKN